MILVLPSGALGDIVLKRAHFFAELAIYDYGFVTENPSAIAFAAVLNALEALNPSHVSNETIQSFHSAIDQNAGVYYEHFAVEKIRSRLWQVYRQSEQFIVEEDVMSVPQEICGDDEEPVSKKAESNGQSPVYVAINLGSSQMCS